MNKRLKNNMLINTYAFYTYYNIIILMVAGVDRPRTNCLRSLISFTKIYIFKDLCFIVFVYMEIIMDTEFVKSLCSTRTYYYHKRTCHVNSNTYILTTMTFYY